MTDQEHPGPQEQTPQFGGGGNQDTNNDQPRYTNEDIQKILNRNSNAQSHIKTLESETAQMRDEIQRLTDELNRSRSIDDLLEAMQQQSNEPNSPGSTTPQLDKNELLADLKKEVFNELSQAQRAELEERNWQETEQLLRQKYGERYGFYVDERAKELDMTNDEMESLARIKPKAFMELIGEKTTKTPSPTQSSQMSVPQNSGDNIEALFEKVQRLRKNPTTEEGREAMSMWSDPAFQAKYRQHILEKARQEGKLN